MTHRHAIIFTGGDAPHERAHRTVSAITTASSDTIIIAADSGWEHAIAAGRTPDILVGDMDSISEEHLAQARASHADIIVHDADKDETDTEIALDTAVERGATHITVIAGGGDRPDHVFAMLHSLTADRYSSATVDGHLGASRFHVCHAHHPVDIHTQPGDAVSLLPVGGEGMEHREHVVGTVAAACDHSDVGGAALDCGGKGDLSVGLVLVRVVLDDVGV